MLQLIQSLNDGSLSLTDVPAPQPRAGFVLARNACSVLSPGTERQMMELASKSLAGKAAARPDLVYKVLDKVRRDGVGAAYRAAFSKLNEPVPVGYSCAGRVIEPGAGCEDLPSGTLVACAGAGYANHAELVLVPKNLCVAVPEGVSAEEAAFGTIGAIAMQGVRTLQPELGESVAVVGLGLLGLLSVQMLRASGCRVLGTDPDEGRVELARELGAAEAWVTSRADLSDRFFDATGGHGVDAVLVAASADSNAPMELAGRISRDRGRIAVVGAVKTEFDRNEYYAKELDVRLSRSYGPGRYDPAFEEKGQSYPRGYIRFTETENLRCFLELVAGGQVQLQPLITHRFPFPDAVEAYGQLMDARTPSLGIVLEYPAEPQRAQAAPPAAKRPRPSATPGAPRVSFVGAGAFARSVLLPAFSGQARLRSIVTGRGYTAAATLQRFAFDKTVETPEGVFEDEATDLVVIATRHDSHADLVVRALEAGKHVFCEKPLALDLDQLNRVERALASSSGLLHVGFNRRFSSMTRELRGLRADSSQPAHLLLRVNAGALPGGHWAADADEGGGRMVGEGCHFVDLARYLIGSAIESVQVMGVRGRGGTHADDNFTANLGFADGSIATLVYTSLGDTRLPKERIELFAGGSAGVLEDFARLSLVRAGRTRNERPLTKDKGHGPQVRELLEAVRTGGPAPVPPEELIEVSRATLALPISLRRASRVFLSDLASETAHATKEATRDASVEASTSG